MTRNKFYYAMAYFAILSGVFLPWKDGSNADIKAMIIGLCILVFIQGENTR